MNLTVATLNPKNGAAVEPPPEVAAQVGHISLLLLRFSCRRAPDNASGLMFRVPDLVRDARSAAAGRLRAAASSRGSLARYWPLPGEGIGAWAAGKAAAVSGSVLTVATLILVAGRELELVPELVMQGLPSRPWAAGLRAAARDARPLAPSRAALTRADPL